MFIRKLPVRIPLCVAVLLMSSGVSRAQCLESVGIFSGSQAAPDDGFGEFISVDGDWMAVGAPNADARAVNAGLVYMFHRAGAQWSEHSVLFDPSGRENDQLGNSVSVSGTRMLAGVSGADLGSMDASAAVVYAWDGSQWVREAVLANPDPDPGDGLQISVLLDGDFAFMGLSGEDLVQTNEGVVHVFHFDGAQWNHDGSIAAPEPHAGDSFGSALAKAGDRLLIGAIGFDGSALNSGAAFVYHLINGEWAYEATLAGSDAEEMDLMGRAIDLHPDWAVLGAASHADSQGAAYVFKRNDTTWTEYARLDSPAPANGREFGYAVGVEGDLMVIGEPDQSHSGGGRAFRYRLANGEWTYEDRMRDIDTWFSNSYGSTLTLSGDTLAIWASQTLVVQRIYAVCVYDLDGRCGPVLSAETGCSAEEFDITVRWSGATPNGRIALIHSPERGFITIPNNNPCVGTWLGLSPGGIRIAYQTTSGSNGGRVLDGRGTRALCGTYLQLLDLQSCLPSNVIRLDRNTTW